MTSNFPTNFPHNINNPGGGTLFSADPTKIKQETVVDNASENNSMINSMNDNGVTSHTGTGFNDNCVPVISNNQESQKEISFRNFGMGISAQSQNLQHLALVDSTQLLIKSQFGIPLPQPPPPVPYLPQQHKQQNKNQPQQMQLPQQQQQEEKNTTSETYGQPTSVTTDAIIDVSGEASATVFRKVKRKIINDYKNYQTLLNSYSLMSDITVDLITYCNTIFINKLYKNGGPEVQYTSRLLNEVSRSYKFILHIYLALAALDVYYNDEEGQHLLKNYPDIDKYFLLQVSFTHKSKCLELYEKVLSNGKPKSEDDAKVRSEALIMTASLVCLYMACCSNYKLSDSRYYQTCKGVAVLSRIDNSHGLTNTPSEVLSKYRVFPTDKDLKSVKEFPRFLEGLFNVQPFEIQNQKVKIYDDKTHKSPEKSRPVDHKDNSSKLAIKNIINPYDDEPSDEDANHEFEIKGLDRETAGENKSEKEEEEAIYGEDNVRSNALRDEKRDSFKSNSFPTFIVSNTTNATDQPNQLKLKFETGYRDLLELINEAYYLYWNRKSDYITLVLKFSTDISQNDEILYLLKHKDPRVIVMISYYISLIASMDDNIWWYDSLVDEIDYIRKILPNEWLPWTDMAYHTVHANWKKKHPQTQTHNGNEANGYNGQVQDSVTNGFGYSNNNSGSVPQQYYQPPL